ncbi:MAG: AMP-binding protein [Egibacteraceae bacterium]
MSTQTIDYQIGMPALDAATLCEAFQITARSHAEQAAVRTSGNGFSMTWGEYDERVRRTAAGLAALGVRRGDTVATMLTNRPELHWVDIAAMHLGAQAFGLYNTSSQEQLEYVLRDAESAVVVTERAFAAKMLLAREACPRLGHVVSVDGGGTLTLDEVDAGGHPGFDFDAAWQAVRPSDVVTLIYTSGTTGPPKGAQITHGAVMASVRPLQQAIPAYRSGFSAISYLPTAHAIARILQHYYSLVYGGTLTCCPDVADLGATLVDARPTLFIGTPRVWEKLQAGLSAAIQAEHDAARRHADEWGIDVGLRRVRVEQAGRQPSAQLLAEHARADALVLSNLRARVGLDRVEGAIIGASPVPPEVIEFFRALGVPLRESYGMTEVMIATVNPIDRVRSAPPNRRSLEWSCAWPPTARC